MARSYSREGDQSSAGYAAGGGSFSLLDFLDANYRPSHTFDKHSSSKNRNIFVVGRPNFPEPAMDSAYELVPVGLVRRVVRRDSPLSTARWVRENSVAWATVAQAFAYPEERHSGGDVAIQKSGSREVQGSGDGGAGRYGFRSGYGYGYTSVMAGGGRGPGAAAVGARACTGAKCGSNIGVTTDAAVVSRDKLEAVHSVLAEIWGTRTSGEHYTAGQ